MLARGEGSNVLLNYYLKVWTESTLSGRLVMITPNQSQTL